MTTAELKAMKLHECKEVYLNKQHPTTIVRVPDGWIYMMHPNRTVYVPELNPWEVING